MHKIYVSSLKLNDQAISKNYTFITFIKRKLATKTAKLHIIIESNPKASPYKYILLITQNHKP